MTVSERLRKTTQQGSFIRFIESWVESVKVITTYYPNMGIICFIFIDGSKLYFRDYNREANTRLYLIQEALKELNY